VLFSTAGAVLKSTSLTPWQAASFRSGIAALVLLAVIPGSVRGWNRHAALVSLACSATFVLFVSSTKLTTAANAIFLQAAAPLYVMALSPWLLRERVRPADVAAMAVIGAGLALVLAGQTAATSVAPDPVLGNILGAASGFTWAFAVIGLRWLARHEGGESSMSTIIGANALTFLVCLPFALPLGTTRATDWAALAWLGVVQIGLAYALFVRGIRRVSALEASMLVLIEPALNPLWAWLVHAERPGLATLAGGSLIVAATAVRSARSAPAAAGGGSRPGATRERAAG